MGNEGGSVIPAADSSAGTVLGRRLGSFRPGPVLSGRSDIPSQASLPLPTPLRSGGPLKAPVSVLFFLFKHQVPPNQPSKSYLALEAVGP